MSDPSVRGADTEKGVASFQQTTCENKNIRGLETSPETALHRGLKARHVSMIAIGGALGTGLLVNTGEGLSQSSPGSLLIAFIVLGAVMFIVMADVAEMASFSPLSLGFTGYCSRYCHPSLGFATGWTYFFKYIVTPNQLVAGSLVIQFWVPRETVNPGAFVAIFLYVAVLVNTLGMRFFGELEYWVSDFKIMPILGLILFSPVIVSGGGPTHEAVGFKYWREPGAFVPLYATGALGRFIGFWSSLVSALFSYLGSELCAVGAAEAQNPRRTIQKAIKLTFYRILVFYCLSIFLVGLIIPYDSTQLAFATKHGTSAAASPFVVAAKLAGVQVLPHIINACLCFFILSASISDLYVATRTLYGLASDCSAPAIFRKTNSRGVPVPALIVCSLFACLAFLVITDDSKRVFGYFVNLTTIFGLLTWVSLLVTYIHFLKARRAQNIPDSAMPYVAPQGLIGTYVALAICVLISITKSFDVFIEHDGEKFDTLCFVTGYVGSPIYLALIFGHMYFTKSKGVKARDSDFYTGKDFVDKEEQAFFERQAARQDTRTGWNRFYDRYISFLF